MRLFKTTADWEEDIVAYVVLNYCLDVMADEFSGDYLETIEKCMELRKKLVGQMGDVNFRKECLRLGPVALETIERVEDYETIF